MIYIYEIVISFPATYFFSKTRQPCLSLPEYLCPPKEKEKIAYTFLKKKLQTKIICFNYQKNIISQTKNFLYLPKKLISYTYLKILKHFILDVLLLLLCRFSFFHFSHFFLQATNLCYSSSDRFLHRLRPYCLFFKKLLIPLTSFCLNLS